MSNIIEILKKDETEAVAWFENIIAGIKAKLPVEHHEAVDNAVSETASSTTSGVSVAAEPPSDTVVNAS